MSRSGPFAAALVFAACSGHATLVEDGGGGGTYRDSGTTVELPGGVSLSDAGLPDARALCLRFWAGSMRLGMLVAQPALSDAFANPSCAGPTPAQLLALRGQASASAAELIALPPPDGGWPDGGGPNICDDPASAFDGLPALLADSLAAGRATWNARADARCRAGLSLSGDLLDLFLGADGGGGSAAALMIGWPDGGDGCAAIFEGNIVDGGACLAPFECRPGLYCRSPGLPDGGCGGVCAPLVPAGSACGPLDQCAGGIDCTAGLCGGLDGGAAGGGGPDASCASPQDCGACLACLAGHCLPPGTAGSPCSSDGDCAKPFYYCNQSYKRCAEAGVEKSYCQPSMPSSCLTGWWCDPVTFTCAPLSGDGGPCVDGVDCQAGLYCAGSGYSASCRPLPGLGDPCGLTPDLTLDCPDESRCALDGGAGLCVPLPAPGQPCWMGSCALGAVCDPDGGRCAPLPGAGEACIAGSCADGLDCDDGGCAPPPGEGQACIAGSCADGLYCADGGCAPALPGGAPCASSAECRSNLCVGGSCATPCSPSAGNCASGPGLSFLLGLGGALAWFDRRRRGLRLYSAADGR